MMEQVGITAVDAQTVRIKIIPTDEIPRAWEQIKELLHTNTDPWKRYWTEEGILGRLLRGEWQFWVAADMDGVFVGMITELNRYETGNTDLDIHWLGGHELQNLDGYFFIAEEWARAAGADEIKTYCRPGVKRMLEKHGVQNSNLCDP